eukprot:5078609-Ditylum_brightwellii.AAC.1
MRLMKNRIKDCSQWFPSKENNISNALSQDNNQGETACEGAVTGKMHKDQALTWRRWQEYAKSIGIVDDIFLDSLLKGFQIKHMGSFAMALCGGCFLGSAYDTLDKGTVRGAISYMVETFEESNCPNPTKDEDCKLGKLLLCQFKAFKNEDPKPKYQKALPIGILRAVAKSKATETKRA